MMSMSQYVEQREKDSYMQTTGFARDKTSLEQYYLKDEYATPFVKAVHGYFSGFTTFDVVIDPAAGTGVYKDALEQFFPDSEIILSDIDPKHPSIEKRDFIKDPHFTTRDPDRKILTITNPPFGTHSNGKAKQFLKNALQFSTAIAFVIPTTFKNHRTIYRLTDDDMRWRVRQEIPLPNNIFSVNGDDFKWECMLQIWFFDENSARKPTPRRAAPQGYQFGWEDKYWCITRDGATAGKVYDKNYIRRRTKEPSAESTHSGIRSPIFKSHRATTVLKHMINGNRTSYFRITGYGKRHATKDVITDKMNILVNYVDQLIGGDDLISLGDRTFKRISTEAHKE